MILPTIYQLSDVKVLDLTTLFFMKSGIQQALNKDKLTIALIN